MSARFTFAVLLALSLALGASCGGGGETPDASTDAARPDAMPPCTTDAQCDDGLFCNGTEHCTEGHCALGSPTICDDGIACTIDSCSETLRRCLARVPDDDGDGAGIATCVDVTGNPLGNDCDDTDANRFPGNHEVCDTAMHDEDCDAATHGGVDADGDGFEDQRCCNGSSCGEDCDDAHPSAHPGATEVCNLVDDDCDTHIDETVATAGFADADRDGYGDPTMPLSACTTAAGFAADGTDCDDTSAARHPGQPEFCDHVDNDCDMRVDEMAGAVTWYGDHDGDGFGSASSGTTSSCVPPVGFSLLGSDCNDGAAAVSPASAELCNAVDDDCNGVADFAIAPGDLEDDDRDGVADAHCVPVGHDCDDRDATSGPGSIETCDGRDNDCDGTVDEDATQVVYYRDVDGDGYGDSRVVRAGCTQPMGFAVRGGDCDDAAATRSPAAHETCNATDDDCDGATDEGEASASCVMPGATMACLSGACVVIGCATGFADCSATTTGCETDVRSDPSHCGSCAPCANPLSSCTAGVCGPTASALTAIQTDVGDVVVERVLSVPASTDVILVGRYTGSLHFGTTTLTSNGGYDGFAVRLRADGTLVWSGSWGGAGFDAIHAAAMLPDGSAFVVGGELCNATLCGGPISGCTGFWQRFASVAAPGCNYADGVAATSSRITGLAMERVGTTTYVYGTGSWTGTANHGIGVSSGGYDGFVFRAREVTGTQPTYEWTRAFTGIYDDTPEDLALDGASNLVVVGATSSSADFGHGPTGHAGYDDAFLVNVDRATGTIGNAGQFGYNLGYDHAYRVIALPNGDVAVAGYSGGPIVFAGATSGGTGSHNLFVFGLAASAYSPHWQIGVSGNVDVAGLGLAGTSLLVSGQFTGAFATSRGMITRSSPAAFLLSADVATGAIGFLRATDGGTGDRSGGTATRSDGRIAWEIEHTSFLGLEGSSLTSGVDQDMAMTVVTP